jgi:hypothetical protein
MSGFETLGAPRYSTGVNLFFSRSFPAVQEKLRGVEGGCQSQGHMEAVWSGIAGKRSNVRRSPLWHPSPT